MYLRHIFIIVIISGAFSNVSAQPYGSIRVILKDCATGHLIDYARVKLLETKQGAINRTDRPTLLIRNVRPGTYTCECGAVGFAPKQWKVTVKDSLETTLNVCLLYAKMKDSYDRRVPPSKTNINPRVSSDDLMQSSRQNINQILLNNPELYTKGGLSGGSDRPRGTQTMIKLPDSVARLVTPVSTSDTSKHK